MTQALSQTWLTFEEYLAYDDGTDRRYELEAGLLTPMPPESPRNRRIALWLLTQFLPFVSLNQLTNKAEIFVGGSRATFRLPDLVVLSPALAAILETETRETITFDMPPPLLMVEVVAPGKKNEDRDYRYKRSEYAARGIAEYWIIDPIRSQVMVLTLVEGLYEEKSFSAAERVESQVFPDLNLTAEQIFAIK
jgi:Uma2 family endonuclease